MKGKIFFLGVFVVLITAFLGAHDFWLVPQKFMLNPNDSLTIYANTGMDFPNSLSAVDPERFTQFIVNGKSGKKDISKFKIEGNSLTTEITLEMAGSTKTDSDGKAVVPLVKTGPYLIRTIHMEWVKKETHDWESYWTSLTFEIPKDD